MLADQVELLGRVCTASPWSRQKSQAKGRKGASTGARTFARREDVHADHLPRRAQGRVIPRAVRGSPEYVARLIEQSALQLAEDYPRDGVRQALQLIRPSASDPLHVLQIKFFVLLNEDERMRRKIAEVQACGVCGLCPHKAERFYDALSDDLFPTWVKDERVSHAEFVDRLRGRICARESSP